MPSWKAHITGWGESDPEEAYQKLEHIYENQDEARERGRRAAKFIRDQFTWDVAVDRIVALMADANIV